jgi:hypothetical protein
MPWDAVSHSGALFALNYSPGSDRPSFVMDQIVEWSNKTVQWSNANQGFLLALLTLVYVLATLWLAWLARRQLKLATDLEKNRLRPFVIFDLVVERTFVFAHLRNTGPTPAWDVRISVSPKIQALLGGEKTFPAEECARPISFIERGIAMLAPGREIKAFIGAWARVRGAHPTLRFEGQVAYADFSGQVYSEPFVADLSAHEGLLHLSRKDIHDVAKELESIARILGQIATPSGNPLIRTITESDYQEEEKAYLEKLRHGAEQQIDTTDRLKEQS